MSENRFCQECKKRVAKSAKFCRHCGVELTDVSSSSSGGGGCLSIIIIIIIIYYIMK